MKSLELSTFIKCFADQFEHTDISIFKPETDFWSLDEWSSITALSVVSMIFKEYGVSIRSADVKGARTINDLFEIVNMKITDN